MRAIPDRRVDDAIAADEICALGLGPYRIAVQRQRADALRGERGGYHRRARAGVKTVEAGAGDARRVHEGEEVAGIIAAFRRGVVERRAEAIAGRVDADDVEPVGQPRGDGV